VPRHLRVQALQPLLDRRALAVGVEAHEAQFPTPGHDNIVIPRLLVLWVVAAVMMLFRTYITELLSLWQLKSIYHHHFSLNTTAFASMDGAGASMLHGATSAYN
jgi:hypothetical protein